MPLTVDTSVRIYDDFTRLVFLHAHREGSALSNEIPEESDQFRFLRAVCFANKASYRSMGTTGDPVPVGHRDGPDHHFTG